MNVRNAAFALSRRALVCSIALAMVILVTATASRAQDASTARSERQQARQAGTANAAQVPPSGTGGHDQHDHCLVYELEGNGSFLSNRCDYPINAMYCNLRDSTRSGCQAQTISLYNGVKTRVSPYQFEKLRWLACRSPARPIETRWRDAAGVQVDWACTN